MYEELIKALLCCSERKCSACPIFKPRDNEYKVQLKKCEEFLRDAATAIQTLTEQVERLTAERDAAVDAIKVIADTYREKACDNGICGLCEYDSDHGIEGYANECPGYGSNHCFKWRGQKEGNHEAD